LANKKKIIEIPIKTACNPENWNTEISAFEKWLLTATLPAAPFHLNRCTVINDIPLFIDVSIETTKTTTETQLIDLILIDYLNLKN